jgi:hypothetical protein
MARSFTFGCSSEMVSFVGWIQGESCKLPNQLKWRGTSSRIAGSEPMLGVSTKDHLQSFHLCDSNEHSAHSSNQVNVP